MFKQSQREIIVPLKDSKFTIMGIYIKTSPVPQHEFRENQLTIKDEWFLQIIYAQDRSINAQKNPSLTEYKTSWQEEFPWPEEKPATLSIRYHKNPKCINSFIRHDQQNGSRLHLTIETSWEINFIKSPLETLAQINLKKKAAPPVKNKSEKKVAEQTKELIEENGEIQKEKQKKEQEPIKIQVQAPKELTEKEVEKQLAKLTALLSTLEKRIETIEKELPPNPTEKSRLNGIIVDAFRLVPIPRAIVEIFDPNSEEPFVKTFSNSRGFYCLDLPSGLYDIKIKHTRFSPLVIKDYRIKKSEEKLQDFMLHRM
jgi:hypothetical protein